MLIYHKARNLPDPTRPRRYTLKGWTSSGTFVECWTFDSDVLCGLLLFWIWLTCLHIGLHWFPYQVLEHLVHKPLIGCSSIFKAEWHCLVAVKTSVGDDVAYPISEKNNIICCTFLVILSFGFGEGQFVKHKTLVDYRCWATNLFWFLYLISCFCIYAYHLVPSFYWI